MIDREKVIKSVDICLGHGHCEDCSYCLSRAGYTTMDCRKFLLMDVLDLLKKNIPVVPIKGEHGKCPICGYKADHHYCPNCGQQLNWFCADGERKKGR